MMRRVLVMAMVLLLAGSTGARAALNYIEDLDKLSEVKVLPPYELKDLGGNTLRWADESGKRVVLLAFWSMYCRACIEKFGALVKLRAKYPQELLQIISINTDGESGLPEETVRQFVRGLEARERITVNFPVAYLGGDGYARQLGIFFLPAILTADRSGKITGVYRRFSEDSEDERIRGIEGIIPEEGRVPPP